MSACRALACCFGLICLIPSTAASAADWPQWGGRDGRNMISDAKHLPDIADRLHCLDLDTGKRVWIHDLQAEAWGSTLIADGKLYLGTKRHFFVLAAGRQHKLLSEIHLGSPTYTSPIVANGTLYAASQRYIWAVAQAAAQKTASH